MENRPLLSIHVAVFNLEKYIAQCLDSILNQEFQDFEIILVDNGSTDESIRICEEYAQKYTKIKYVKLPLPTVLGRPYCYARNNYKGSYFMTVDGDDYLADGALKNIVTAIKKSNYADLIMGTFTCDIEEGMTNLKDAIFDENRINDVTYSEALEYITTLPNFHTFQWRFITKRGRGSCKHKQLEFQKDDLISPYNDSLSLINYFMNSDSIYFIKEPFYIYRRRKSSVVCAQTNKGQQALDFMKTFIVIADRLKKVLKDSDNIKKKWIFQVLEARYEMFRILMNEMNNEQWEQTVALFEKYIETILLTTNTSYHTKRLVKCLVESDSIRLALDKYREDEIQLVMQNINKCVGKKIYVFPTGMCGESTCSLITKNNIKIEAFLDNDILKQGKLFENSVCKLPIELENEEQIQDCCVYIATAYRNNIEIMKKQVRYYGIKDENIFVR